MDEMAKILCDECKKEIGTIRRDAHIVSFDVYVGITHICSECYGKCGTLWDKQNQLLEDGDE